MANRIALPSASANAIQLTMTRKAFVWLLVLCLAVPVGAARAQTVDARLQGVLDDFVREQRLPGAVLGVNAPRLDQVAATGVLDRKTGIRVTPQSRFYIASVGKMMTATAILQLVEEGRIRLDQRVSEILSPAGSLARLPNWKSVTVEQLLNHTSGMPDYFDDDYEKAAAKDPRMLVDVERALSPQLGEEPNARPGVEHEYSNTNYALLGLVLERVDHLNLAAVLARRIFVPAGMTATTVGADPSQPGVASGHGAEGAPSARDNLIAYGSKLGDGPVTTTAGSLGRFLTALLRDKKLLRPATLQLMITPSRREPSYGLGIQISNTDFGPCYGHSGSVTGFKAEAWYYAARQTAIVFLANGEFYSDDTDVVTMTAQRLFK
jgi:D-alanyl-D-alanine carboxypeptidase